jgi:uncharacterized OB-fold protein
MTLNEGGQQVNSMDDFEEFLELATEGEYVGRCKKCGHIQYGCETDAQNYECEECGAKAVDGAMYALM